MRQHFMYSEGGGFRPTVVSNPEDIEFLIIDLFCGAGGTTIGFDNAKLNGKKCALVIACVNHDWKAIKSHWENHPEVVHFEEDIRTLDLAPLAELTAKYRMLYPNAQVILWASLECTNFSKAKGGQPRDADSRTLADHLDRYVIALNPDYIKIENVVEFMSWGPLISKTVKHKDGAISCPINFVPEWAADINDEISEEQAMEWRMLAMRGSQDLPKIGEQYITGWRCVWQGVPESKKSGKDFVRWCKHIDSFGYRHEWKELNSADFGAYTSRNRLFGCFAKPGLPIVWPEATHAKKPETQGLFGSLQKWKPVKDVLDFSDEGESIFNRKKPLVDASLERIEAGLIKFVAGGKEAFLLQYNSGSANHRALDVDGPCNTVLTSNRFAIAQTAFIAKYYSGKPAGKVIPVTAPAGTICTASGQALVQCTPFILNTNFQNVGRSVEEPHTTLMASRRHPYLVNPSFLTKYHGTGENILSIDGPASTLTLKDRLAKVQPVWCESFILNPSHGGHCTSTAAPSPVIVARQDKAPLYLVKYDLDPNVSIPIYEDDSEVMIRIKKFMALYGISDIKMRMLKVPELLQIQGFPVRYKLFGNQSDQKKFIGNSVVPLVVQCWSQTMALKVREWRAAA